MEVGAQNQGLGSAQAHGPLRIVAIGGALEPRSNSLDALKRALDACAQAGAAVQLLDIRELDLPLYSWGLTPPPAALQLNQAVAQAHGLLWATPLYHGTVSGAFKNTIDWLELLGTHQPPYLTDKVVGLICTAGGTHGLQAINTMEFIVRSLRGLTLPLVVPIDHAGQVFDSDGQILKPVVAEQLDRLGRELVRTVERLQRF